MNHWCEWKFTRCLGRGYRRSSIGAHRVAVMIEAERRSQYGEGFIVSRVGRTVCGAEIRFVEELSPTGMPRSDPFECWTVGWRPCSVCFPDFDIATWRRIRAIEERWEHRWGRLYELLWTVVMRRRAAKATAA